MVQQKTTQFGTIEKAVVQSPKGVALFSHGKNTDSNTETQAYAFPDHVDPLVIAWP